MTLLVSHVNSQLVAEGQELIVGLIELLKSKFVKTPDGEVLPTRSWKLLSSGNSSGSTKVPGKPWSSNKLQLRGRLGLTWLKPDRRSVSMSCFARLRHDVSMISGLVDRMKIYLRNGDYDGIKPAEIATCGSFVYRALQTVVVLEPTPALVSIFEPTGSEQPMFTTSRRSFC
jgi:hypothetical protein